MNAIELKTQLLAAPSRERWVELVAEYLSTHAIVCGHGAATPADEAFWLIWQLSGCPEDLFALDVDTHLGERIAELAERRVVERIPLAYLLGSAWFAGLEFEIERGVLIPRSPLAELIEQQFTPWCRLASGDRLLEIGTGSGCIAAAAAVHVPGLSVDATEIDERALALARRNIRKHAVASRVTVHEADLFPASQAEYRVIISNPPYVPTADIAALPPEFGHEPAAALDGGRDGLDVVRCILDGAGQRLTQGGVLIVEVGVAAQALLEQYPSVPWTWIEFERGGDGVFVLTAEELRNAWR